MCRQIDALFAIGLDGVPSVQLNRHATSFAVASGQVEGSINQVSVRRGKWSIGPVRNVLSLALFAVAAVLFIIVGVMYIRDERKGNEPAPTPASIPGKAQLKNVFDALAAQDLDVEYARGAGPRFAALSPPAQGLIVNGQPLYVFIFEDPALREEATTDLTLDDLIPTALVAGGSTPETSDAPHGIGGSNIYTVLLGGDEKTTTKVDAAIQGIP